MEPQQPAPQNNQGVVAPQPPISSPQQPTQQPAPSLQQQTQSTRKSKKIIVVVTLVVLLVMGGIGYYLLQHKGLTNNTRSEDIKNWLTTNQVQSKTDAIKQDGVTVGDTASNQNTAQMLAACQQLSTDVQTAQAMPAGPDQKLNQELTTSLGTLSNSSAGCVKALNTKDSGLLTTSGQDTSTGFNQLATFVNDAKVFLGN
jgi:uncharacterized protein HemX